MSLLRNALKNFNFKVMLAYFIVFAPIACLSDYLLKSMEAPNFTWSSYLIGLLIRSLCFAFMMSLFFGKKVSEKWNQKSKN